LSSENREFDLIVKNVRVVRPNEKEVNPADIGIKAGKFASIAPSIEPSQGAEIFDAEHKLGFPGAVDAHMHVGIYSPLAEDAVSESKAAAMGGVTTSLNYMRTGKYYLNKGGPYAEFFPQVLETSDSRFYVDYAFHLAPIDPVHIDEMDMLATQFGVTSFKIFMFYGSYGLHGQSDQQNKFLMIGDDDRYDFAHFEFIMRSAAKVIENHPELKDYVSVSLHCEVADILRAYTQIVEKRGDATGLRAYHEARPPHAEGLAIWIAAYLAHEAECPNINLLHLSSRKAIEAARMMSETLPHISFGREVTVGHLLMDVDSTTGLYAKVNPPIRPREDVEYLWKAVLDGEVDWIVSDHACCSEEMKLDPSDPENLWLAKSGFGGTEYLLSGVYSEGTKRGLSPNRAAELVSWNPAQRFGLLDKGDIAVGYDADLVLLDPDETFSVRASESFSEQGYSPFEGQELTGRVKSTFLRGNLVYNENAIHGDPMGKYLERPYGSTGKAD